MNLEEFVREKYETGNKKTSTFDSKYQLVLKRINAVFGCFESYFSKSGTRNKIVCDQGPRGFDSFESSGSNAEMFYYAEIAKKLTAIFMFVVMNYYAPNPKSERQKTYIDLDELFNDFINGIYHGPKRLEDIQFDFRKNLFQTRVRLGKDFEEHLLQLSGQEKWMENTTTEFCKKMLLCKKEALKLFQWLTGSEYTAEEMENKIDQVYCMIFELCEKIRVDKNLKINAKKDNLVYEYMIFDVKDPLFVIGDLENRMDIKEVLFEEDAKEFYKQFRFLLDCFRDMLNKSETAIDNIDEKEKMMLNYLLDEFGKGLSEKTSGSNEKKVLDCMKSDQWESFPLAHRERLLFLINNLIEDDKEEDNDRYERLNKYIRAYNVDGVKNVLERIEFKMKFPQVYRGFRYLEKLYDLYRNMENAETIMSFLNEGKLNAFEKKIQKIFAKQEKIYRYCMASEESEQSFVTGKNDFLESFSDRFVLPKDTENLLNE